MSPYKNTGWVCLEYPFNTSNLLVFEHVLTQHTHTHTQETPWVSNELHAYEIKFTSLYNLPNTCVLFLSNDVAGWVYVLHWGEILFSGHPCVPKWGAEDSEGFTSETFFTKEVV